MNKNDYEEKMLMLLADNKTYKRIDSKVNPLKSYGERTEQAALAIRKRRKNN